MKEFLLSLTESLDAVYRQVRRSLVVIHNGKRGIGAGVVWGEDGWIVTNHHVVAGKATSNRLRVAFQDDSESPAEIVSADPQIDLSLLRVDRAGLTPVKVNTSKSLRVGNLVFAVGHPWGQRSLVTAGLVSGFSVVHVMNGRKTTDRTIEVIRSDVRLAPGNSGGPLVNTSGEVVGINTMVVGGDIGVAIPSHEVMAFFTTARKRKQPVLNQQGDVWLA